ncbi:MAG: C-type lectin domain-containing protein [Myxococcota bacterium]
MARTRAVGPWWGMAVAVLGLAPGLGCGSETGAVPWEVRFSDEALRAESARIETTVHRGGCGAPDVLYRAELRRDAAAPSPPALPPGRYGFAAMARDAECRTVARGCVEAQMPSESVVELVLEAVDESAACEAAACDAGFCEGDAPPSDGGMAEPMEDAGSPPMPEPDGGDGSQDAGEPPPACETRDGGCYVLRTDSRAWGSAASECLAWGGHLVTIDDESEEQWLIATFGPALDVWIGLSDRNEEGTFTWMNGSEADYRNWTSSAPDDRGGGEDCVALNSDSFGWDDRKCQQERAYICEQPAD